MHPCSKAFDNTDGQWNCTRDEGHPGPCAAVPRVSYEQLPGDLTVQQSELNRCKRLLVEASEVVNSRRLHCEARFDLGLKKLLQAVDALYQSMENR
jgi:hypothetical protein